MQKVQFILTLICLSSLGCHATGGRLRQAVMPTDVRIIRYHVEEYYKSLEKFIRRLYLKNPTYEKDLEIRRAKIEAIFHGGQLPYNIFNNQPSHKVLEAAFAPDPAYKDRVFLLGLGLVKSIQETYKTEEAVYLTSMEIPIEKLERLYNNISQVNWRLKVYHDEDGKLLFSTNEAGKNGYINMGYEVIMTEILTRIKDDIYLRGGAPSKLAFTLSTMFLPILLF